VNEIANQYKIGSWKVGDLLRQYGIPKRSKAESQTLALKKGRAPHPTKGKKLSKEHREKIGESMVDSWDEDVKRIKEAQERMKRQWEEMPKTEKEKKLEALRQSAYDTARAGSKTEKYMMERLMENGWVIEQHRKDLVLNHKMHTDIYVPQARTVIEVDGPTHISPIYGEEQFYKTVAADNQKNGLLLSNGYCIIRLREEKSKKTNYYRKKALEKVLFLLERNKNEDVPLIDRLSIVEIS
jgi:very-short-patch-repair endonuclease